MKLRNLFLCAFAAAAALVGCNKENGEEQTGSLDITLSTETLEFEAAKSTKTVEVTAGREWKATYDEPEGGAWFSVSPESAKGNQTVEIDVSENTGYDRSAEIKFSNGLKNKTLKITQKGTSAFATIAEVRAMYQGSTVNVADGIKVKGVVISNKNLNNLTSKKSLYVQDATAGINVYCTADHSFAFGDEVVFDLSGAELKDYNNTGLIEINNFDLSKAKEVGTAIPEAKTVSVDDFLDDKYQGQYVAIADCQVADADLTKKWCNSTSSNTSITVDHKDGKSFVVFTSKYATTLTEVPQGSGTIKGIASVNNGTAQLIFAQGSDYAGLTGDRFEGPEAEEISIAKVFETTVNTTVKVKGAVVAVSNVSIVLNDGGDQNLYVYTKTAPTVKVGDSVLVEGKVATYGSTSVKLIQISEPTITAYSGTITPKSETAVELTAAEIDTYSSVSSSKIKVNAIVKESVSNGKTYKNLDFGGTIVGSAVSSSLDSELTDGRVVVITGYYAATTSYFNILPVEVKASSASFFGVSDQNFTVGGTTTSVTFNVTGNVDWTAVSNNSNFVVSPASGKGEGTVTVKFPANTDSSEKTATITVSTTASVSTKSFDIVITQAGVVAGLTTTTLDFVNWGFSGASDWASSYADHEVPFEVATVKFASANKQSSTSTITDCPVTKGENVEVIMSEGKTLGAVTVNLKQWGTKAQTAKLFTSTDGGVNYSASEVASSTNFTLVASSLGEGVNAVKVTFSSKNQVGIASIEISYK